MTTFNEFMKKATDSGVLNIEHRRQDGIVPNTEHMADKLTKIVAKNWPNTKVAISVSGPFDPKPSSSHALAVEATLRASSSSSRYLALGDPIMGGTQPPAGPQGSANVNLFAALHECALADFDRMSAEKMPIAAVASASGALFPAITPARMAVIDSIFQRSFADTRAIMGIAAVEGAAAGKKIVDAVIDVRVKNGDIDSKHMNPKSHDTSGALTLVAAELNAGADYSRLNAPAAEQHARSVAAQGIGIWLSSSGVPAAEANGFADFVDMVASTAQISASLVNAGPTSGAKDLGPARSRPQMK